MLNSKGFDLWADNYDTSVNMSEESNTYPFAGYKDVLNGIYRMVRTKEFATILDIGFGTGILTKKLYDDGYSVYGLDFSEKMIEIAKTKMPKATLIKHDFTLGMPEMLKNKQFDFIICTYAIHHLQDEEKFTFISELLDCISPGGKILIGDVAFETKAECGRCKAENTDIWDDEEMYPTLEAFYEVFPNVSFEKKSFCAGVFSFEK